MEERNLKVEVAFIDLFFTNMAKLKHATYFKYVECEGWDGPMAS